MGVYVGGVVETFQGGILENRIGGTFRHPNYLAEALVLIWPSILAVWLNSETRHRWFFFLALSGALGTLLLTLSRGGWAGGTAATFVYGVMLLRIRGAREILRRNRRMIFLGLASGAILLAVFSGPVFTKLLHSNPLNIKSRQDLNHLALYMVDQHPVLGVGILNSNVASRGTYLDRRYRQAVGLPPVIHNIYLLICAEIGIPGLAFFLGVVGLVLAAGWRSSIRIRDPIHAQIIIGLTAGLCGFLVSEFFGPGLRKMDIANLFWCQMGLLMALSRLSRPDSEQ